MATVKGGRETKNEGRGENAPIGLRAPGAPPADCEITLSFENNRSASSVFGLYDQNLAKIERRLRVACFANGNHVTLKGISDNCERARRVLEMLYDRVGLGLAVEPGDVDRAIDESSSPESRVFDRDKNLIAVEQGNPPVHDERRPAPEKSRFMEADAEFDPHFVETDRAGGKAQDVMLDIVLASLERSAAMMQEIVEDTRRERTEFETRRERIDHSLDRTDKILRDLLREPQ